MATEFKLPELGENIETGDVVTVLVAVGDAIEQNLLGIPRYPASVQGSATNGL